MEETSYQSHWLRVARRIARRINFGWWLERMSTPLIVTSLVFACGLIAVRREFPEIPLWQLLAGCAAGLSILGGVCWVIAARKFETPQKVLVRIEAEMAMKNSLSVAMAGIAPWPSPVAAPKGGLHWQWPRLLIPPVGALIILAASLFIPVTAAPGNSSSAPEQPQAWKKLETQLDRLTKEEAVDQKYLEETRKQLDELKAQEEEQWFSHSSLEATDSLKKSHNAEAQRMERDLDRAEKALSELEKSAGTASEAEKNRMMEEYDQALQALQRGAMKPNPKLLEQMQELDPKNLAKLSPEQIKQLKENLKKNQQAMKESGGGEAEDWSEELLADQNDEGKNGQGKGQGDIERGPGHSPGVLGKEKGALELGDLTGLQAKDLSKSTPGDLLELQTGEHDVDRSASAISAGGQTDSTGKGGDRVWRDSLDPAEQNALKRFFE